MSSREPGSRTSSPGSYLVYIEDLPATYTWKDLKDLIRAVAWHGIWTEMAIRPNEQSGGKGWARVQRAGEARNLYKYLVSILVENRALCVHLWDTSGPEARFMCCNCDQTVHHPPRKCPVHASEVTPPALPSDWQVVVPHAPTSPDTATYPFMIGVESPPGQSVVPFSYGVSSAAIVPTNSSLPLNVPDPPYAEWYPPCYEPILYAPRAGCGTGQPIYTMSSHGTPINIMNGTVRTEARGVFISRLNFEARSQDVETLFRRAGDISRCEVRRNAATGKSKGIAVVQYASAAQAQRAIQMFHGTPFMNMKLHVRRDKEAVVVGPLPKANQSGDPLIVNGSYVC